MFKSFVLITLLISIAMTACTKSVPTAATVEYPDVCTDANKGKQIAVQGFLNVAPKTPCLMMLTPTGIKRRCAFKLMDKINVSGQEIIVYLAEGKESNQAETPDAGQSAAKESKIFARNEIKMRLDDGTVVVPQENIATPVTVSGEVNLTENGSDKICSIAAAKVEKR